MTTGGRCGHDAAVTDSTDDFDRHYRLVGHPALMRAESRVIGADYGATSYTTKAQADGLARSLDLQPNSMLLDVGSGAGWPGIYLAAATGCRVVLSDVPLDGLRAASNRIGEDRISGDIVAAEGGGLPFHDRVFDAVTSSDVLC